MKKKIFWSFILLIISFNIFADTSAVNRLSDLLKSFSTYQANFSQMTYSEQGRVIQRGSGRIMIKRPGKFRWETKLPTQQILITDGKTLWVYDVDLQQVSQQALSARIGIDPAMLLSGAVENLESSFVITTSQANHAEIFILRPKRENLGFNAVQLTFKAGQLVNMQVVNNLSQTSEFNFSNIKINDSLSDDLFLFKAPAGVDVISQ